MPDYDSHLGSDVVVGAVPTPVLMARVGTTVRLSIALKNTGAAAFSACVLEGRVSPDSGWVAIADDTDSFTPVDPQSLVRWSNGVDPTVLASGAEAIFSVEVADFWEMRVTATTASSTTARASYKRVEAA